MNADILKDLEAALLVRNPRLVKRLQPGLTESKIRKMLDRAEIRGDIEPLIQFYTWKNGMVLNQEVADLEGFFPKVRYDARELEQSILDFEHLQVAAKNKPGYSEIGGRYFPILWDSNVSWIAVDLEPSSHHRIMLITTRGTQPLQEAYGSIEEFMADLIRANQEGVAPVFFEGKLPLLNDLEGILILDDPLLGKRLQMPLPGETIKAQLREAGIEGDTTAVVGLYSWKNGTRPDAPGSLLELSIFPESIYQFLSLEVAIQHLQTIGQAAAYHPMLSEIGHRYFPAFWDNATGYLMLDLAPGMHNRVLVLDFESEEPLREAYKSFNDFVLGAIRANLRNNPLSCFE